MTTRRLLALLAALLCASCSAVRPYERGRLAHFSMRASDAASLAQAHVQAIQEGATGGSVEATTGCGCN